MTEIFNLIGLNKRTNGAYATVECGKEDWFHADFSEKSVPADRQQALFDMFKNCDDNLWSNKKHQVVVTHDGYSTGGVPKNPLIVEIKLDDL